MAYKHHSDELAYQRKWQAANRKKCRAYCRKWRNANLENERQRAREWINTHPEYVKQYRNGHSRDKGWPARFADEERRVLRAFCFRRCRWRKNGIDRNSWKKRAPKRVCAPVAGRMRTRTSSCFERWYSARNSRKRLCPRHLCLQAHPRGQESRRQVYRRTEPCSFPKTKHGDEVTAQQKRARASAQQIDGIECT